MGKPTLLLSKGVSKLDLNDQSTYYLSQDFVPPATVYAPQITEGTSANRLQGGSFVSKRATNRSFSFTVAIKGTSSGKINQAVRNIKWFLSQAGNRSEPLYLEYNPNSSVPEPLWGQFGVSLHYEIVFGDCVAADGYMVGVRRSEDINVTITLTLKPFALGQPQRLCSVGGGIQEDVLGASDGISRGVIIPAGVDNIVTNPVFGNSTYDTGWTTGANLIKAKITDPEFVPFGYASVELTSKHDTTNNGFYISATVAATTYTTSIYLMKRDKSAISITLNSEDFLLYVGGLLVSPAAGTIVSLGNGLYKFFYAGPFNAGTFNFGIALENGQSIILCGMQMEASAYDSPMAHGDMMGHSWASTAHASVTTRTAAVCKISIGTEFFNHPAITIRCVFKTAEINAGRDMYLFDLRDGTYTGAPYAYIASGGSRVSVIYNGNNVQSAVLSANTVYVLHVTITVAGLLSVYTTGALSNSASCGFAQFGANLFIGSNYSGASQWPKTISGFGVVNKALSSVEVGAEYNEISPLVSAGQYVEHIPWLWTKDGDAVVDNYYDATHNMHCVIGGIPGSSDALTNVNATTDENATGFNVYQALYKVATQVDVADFFEDLSGTTDAAALGGNAALANISTGTTYNLLTLNWKNFKNGPFSLLIRSKDAGSNLSVKATYTVGGIYFEESEASKVGATYGIQLLAPQFIKYLPETPGIVISIVASRSTGSGNFSIDYDLVLPGDVCVWKSLNNGYNLFDYQSDRVNVDLYNNGLVGESNSYDGRPIELAPNVLNYLFSHIGDANTSTLTRTLTYNHVKVTPRYELL